jgi:AcrR family transcriptional regulator
MPGKRTNPATACDQARAGDLPARERILAAARNLFAERGFDRTSTARIAAAAAVPHGLIFYHFKTKMDLLLAVIRDDEVTALDGLLPPLGAGAGPQQAIAELWLRLSAVLGRPSATRRIIIQELAAHPEVRQRALEMQDRITEIVSRYLARASGHAGDPLPEHEAAARLLTIAAGMAPLLGKPGHEFVQPEALAALIADGLARTGTGHARSSARSGSSSSDGR